MLPRYKPLLYLGLLLLLGMAVFVRVKLGRPPDFTRHPLSQLEAQAGRAPRNYWLQLELGLRYVRIGRQASAIAAFERCREIDPHKIEAYSYLGTMYLQRRDYPRAHAMFERAVACDPRFEGGLLELGKLSYDLNELGRAREATERYIELKPRDWQGYYLRGLLDFTENSYTEAERSFSRVVQLAPRHAPAYLALGLTHLEQAGHREQAADWFQRGLEVDPHYANLHYYAGITHFRGRNWPSAAASLQRAVELAPGLTEAYYPLGQALRRCGRRAEAKRYLAVFARQRTGHAPNPAQQIHQALRDPTLQAAKLPGAPP